MKFRFSVLKRSELLAYAIICFLAYLPLGNRCLAQGDLQRYYNNIVGVDNNFGFIVGQDDSRKDRYYFLMATLNEPVENLSTVFFYHGDKPNSAKLIRTFKVGEAYVGLYSIMASTSLEIQRLSYSSIGGVNQKLRSYINNGKADGVWFNNNASYEIFSRSEQLYRGKVTTGEYYESGMPLIDYDGSVVGLVASEQDKNKAEDVTFIAVDMADIFSTMYEATNCNYFKLIKRGSAETICVLNAKESEKKASDDKKIRSDNKIYAIAMGPAFSGHLAVTGGAGGFGFTAGWSFYLRPDVGIFRAALKPRYSYSRFNLEEPIELSSNNIKVHSFRNQVFEVPILLEWVFKRDKSSNDFFGIGYAPGYQLPLTVQYSSDTHVERTKLTVEDASVITGAFVAELGLEIGSGRIILSALYQTTPISGDADWIYMEGYSMLDFQSETGSPFRIGVELEFRLKGKWGLKGKD
ncbi:hypothetical protein WBG78_14365 [Chryseolinea sp. T2]|uniref:hypothetical protein n=1 Tax=Chryseolinea sp. T2 TaxID=3129255 RepID=UPI0030789A94